jgi:hypothetical protein
VPAPGCDQEGVCEGWSRSQADIFIRDSHIRPLPPATYTLSHFGLRLHEDGPVLGVAALGWPGVGFVHHDVLAIELFVRTVPGGFDCYEVALRDMLALVKHLGMECIVFRDARLTSRRCRSYRRAGYYLAGRVGVDEFDKPLIIPTTELDLWVWFAGRDRIGNLEGE